MRTALAAVMVIGPTGAMVFCAYFAQKTRVFLAETRSFRSAEDVERLRILAAPRRHGSLAVFALVWTAWAAYGYGVIADWLGAWDLLYVAIPSLLGFFVGRYGRSLDRVAQTLPAESDELKRERERVVNLWRHEWLPDWWE